MEQSNVTLELKKDEMTILDELDVTQCSKLMELITDYDHMCKIKDKLYMLYREAKSYKSHLKSKLKAQDDERMEKLMSDMNELISINGDLNKIREEPED